MLNKLISRLPAVAAVVAMAPLTAAFNQDDRTTTLEQRMSQVHTSTSNNTEGAQTALGSPQVDGYGVDISVDVLYWRSRVQGTNYAISDNAGSTLLPWTGQFASAQADWDWGFRIGAGLTFDYDGWDVQAQYTYFENTGSDESVAGNNDGIRQTRSPYWLMNGDLNETFLDLDVGRAKSSIKIGFDNLDLQLGRNYYVSEALSLRPFVAAQTAWIDVTQRTVYSNLEGIYVDDSINVNETSKFWGLGPEIGVGSKWSVKNGVSVFGLVTGGLLYGNFDQTYSAWTSRTLGAFTENKVTITNDTNGVAPNTRLNVGLRYDTYLNNNAQHFGIALSYDTQYWFGVNKTAEPTDGIFFTRYNDLSMQGITLSARLDF